jgi:signal transduction histidine kinase
VKQRTVELFDVLKVSTDFVLFSMDDIGFALLAVNDAGLILSATPPVRRIFRKNEGEVEGQSLLSLLPELEAYADQEYSMVEARGGVDMWEDEKEDKVGLPFLECLACRAHRGGRVEVHSRACAEPRWLEVAVYKLNLNDELVYAVLIFDIDHRKTIEESIRDLNENLEQKVAQRTGELINAQQEILAKQKMAAMGTLTASIAHEINNPNNFILVGSQNVVADLGKLRDFMFSLMDEEADGELKAVFDGHFDKLNAQIQLIQEGSQRINAIVSGLQSLSRFDHSGPRDANIGTLIEETSRVVQSCNRDRLNVDLQLAERPQLFCWVTELSQMLMNLMANAVDAISERQKIRGSTGRGLIAVTTQATTLDESPAIRIVVEDDGIGMSDAVLSRAFEPFFTTKGPGEGAGLGLSNSLAIVEHHRGTLVLESRPGAGTKVIVTLPLVVAPQEALPA